MVKRDSPRFGQGKTTPAPFEEVVAQRRLQRLDLGGQCRLRQIQSTRGAGQCAIRGDRAEQAQVMQVDLGHHSTGQNVLA